MLLWFAAGSCTGSDYGVLQPTPEDLCKCLPVEPNIADFRHIAKHTAIPNIAAQEIGVDTILSWTQDAFVAPDAPRTGRELQVFHIANAFVQEASVNAADCDVHFEISMTADKNAARDRGNAGGQRILQRPADGTSAISEARIPAGFPAWRSAASSFARPSAGYGLRGFRPFSRLRASRDNLGAASRRRYHPLIPIVFLSWILLFSFRQ